MDAETARDLLAVIIDWPGASDGVRRVASGMWEDLEPGVPADLDASMARLTGELRACRYDRDRGITHVVAELRDGIRTLADADRGWAVTDHDMFAARTRARARAAGMDI